MYTKLAITGIVVLIALLFAPGILQLKIDQDISASLLSRSGKESKEYLRYLEHFPADYGAIVVATGSLCTPDMWRAITELSAGLANLQEVDQVVSLPTAKYVTGSSATISVQDFSDVIAPDGSDICSRALGYRPYRDLLIADDGASQALYVIAEQRVDTITFSNAVDEILEEYEPVFVTGASGDLLQSGELAVSAELSKLTWKSSALIAVVMLLMFATVWLLTKSIRAGMLSITAGGLAVYFTFALMGYMGITQNPTNALVVNMLIPLGAAFTIHAYEYKQRSRESLLPRQAVGPFVFATLTTIVGYGSTAVSSVTDIQHFGLLGAFGILACLGVTFGLILPWLPASATSKRNLYDRVPSLFRLSFDVKSWQVLIITVVLVFLSFWGMSRLNVNYAPIDYLTDDNAVRVDFEKAGERFGRYMVPVTYFGREPNEALSPQLWHSLNKLVTDAEHRFPGMKAAWLYDQFSVLSKAFTDGQVRPLKFPDTPELMAQFLLFFEPDDVEPYLDWERRCLTIMFQAPFRDSSDFREFEAMVNEFAKEHELNVVVTGRVANFFRVGDLIAQENLQSLAVGLVVIFLLFWLLLRSLGLAALAVFVNAVPVLGALAFMGLFNVDLDIGSSIVAAIALGLVVDDTGHMIVRYNNYRTKGISTVESARCMIAELWRPVTRTTITIAIGFSVLNFAEMVPFHTFSRLLTGTMIYALVADLFLLPALLICFDRRRLENLAD